MSSVDIINNSQLLLWLASSADVFRVYTTEHLRNSRILEIIPELSKQWELIYLSFIFVCIICKCEVGFVYCKIYKWTGLQWHFTNTVLTLALQFGPGFWSESCGCVRWPGFCSLCVLGLQTGYLPDETEMENLLKECTQYGPTVSGHSLLSVIQELISIKSLESHIVWMLGPSIDWGLPQSFTTWLLICLCCTIF